MDQDIQVFDGLSYVPLENSSKYFDQLTDSCKSYDIGGRTYTKLMTGSSMQISNIFETHGKTVNGGMEQHMGTDSVYISPVNTVPQQNLVFPYQQTEGEIGDKQPLQNTFVGNAQSNTMLYAQYLSPDDVSLQYSCLQPGLLTSSSESQYHYGELLSSNSPHNSGYTSMGSILSHENKLEPITTYQQAVANIDAEQPSQNTIVHDYSIQQTMNTDMNNAYGQSLWYTGKGQPIYLVPSTSSSPQSHYEEPLSSNNSPHYDYQQPSTSRMNEVSPGEHSNNNVEAMQPTSMNPIPASDSAPESKQSPKSTSVLRGKPQRSVRRNVVKYSDFQCNICGEYCKSKCGLTQHTKIHAGYEHRCSRCGKHFETQELLDEHIAKHVQTDKPWKCVICPRAYMNKSDLKRHVQDHNPASKPHGCPKCAKRFSRADQRDLHLASHERKEAKLGRKSG
ncbi:zinc finger protein 236-like [Toxorhynchites rutilus septentrionalis]|uniref:zinc finger protein 236-like n=1 Tax=Toxorhynchites rutilus septentrionalis TaxID=329112 RepID=UPI00247B00F6|nr:zinc finger protein 236-like [Toxorhynchites rutilus septentrionalis]XP_055633765.1 zinc finger protein 236-like [Toxorhynchites rutilus septentrionalis]